MKLYWSEFFKINRSTLEDHYPGISLSIFLRDLAEIIQKDLYDSVYSISSLEQNLIKEKLLSGFPLAYLLGFSEFYGRKFFINSDVLIPRPETELMVDLIVTEFKGNVEKVLDVGTGSGVILLSLLGHGVGESGVGGDISPAALKVAKINANRLRLSDKAEFKLSDRLEKIEGTFDLIVSNPPYIKHSTHKKLVHKNVDQYEPHTALYLDDDVYEEWFTKFFNSVKSHLKGVFYMEGHEDELSSQATLLHKLDFKEVSVIKDLTGRPRFLKAYYK